MPKFTELHDLPITIVIGTCPRSSGGRAPGRLPVHLAKQPVLLRTAALRYVSQLYGELLLPWFWPFCGGPSTGTAGASLLHRSEPRWQRLHQL
jgi:hypothetical protein